MNLSQFDSVFTNKRIILTSGLSVVYNERRKKFLTVPFFMRDQARFYLT